MKKITIEWNHEPEEHQAEEVMKRVAKIAANHRVLIPVGLVVDEYANGRERGFSVRPGNLPDECKMAVCFSENRNSDSIVVYSGEHENGTATELTFNARRFFPYMDYDKAARYVIQQLALQAATMKAIENALA